MARKVRAAFDPKVFLSTVDHGRTNSLVARNAVIFRQSGPADAVFYIQKGRIKIVVTSKQGKEAVVGVLGVGDFFGEGCLIGQPRRLASAKAMTDSEIVRVARTEMVRLLQDEPEFGEVFMRHLLTRNSRVEEDLVDQLFNSSEKRLARALLLLARYGMAGPPRRLRVKVSQEILAEMVGTTRPRVNYFMNKFRRLGFIEYNGGIQINEALLSVVLHE